MSLQRGREPISSVQFIQYPLQSALLSSVCHRPTPICLQVAVVTVSCDSTGSTFSKHASSMIRGCPTSSRGFFLISLASDIFQSSHALRCYPMLSARMMLAPFPSIVQSKHLTTIRIQWIQAHALQPFSTSPSAVELRRRVQTLQSKHFLPLIPQRKVDHQLHAPSLPWHTIWRPTVEHDKQRTLVHNDHCNFCLTHAIRWPFYPF